MALGNVANGDDTDGCAVEQATLLACAYANTSQ
jgi:hypothetical protein